MIIYTIVSRKNRTAFRKSREIINVLEKNDCKLSIGVYPGLIEKKKNLIPFVQKQIRLMKAADAIILDALQYSPVIGFLIANALLNNKFILFLHESGSGIKSLNLSDASGAKNFHSEEYSDHEGMEIILKKFLNDSRRKLNKRFILNISNEIEQYLDWVSQEWGINKAETVRRAVLNAIHEDEEYRKSIGN